MGRCGAYIRTIDMYSVSHYANLLKTNAPSPTSKQTPASNFSRADDLNPLVAVLFLGSTVRGAHHDRHRCRLVDRCIERAAVHFWLSSLRGISRFDSTVRTSPGALNCRYGDTGVSPSSIFFFLFIHSLHIVNCQSACSVWSV